MIETKQNTWFSLIFFQIEIYPLIRKMYGFKKYVSILIQTPRATLAADTEFKLLLGEHAWRIDISQVSRTCDNEKSDGIFNILAENIF